MATEVKMPKLGIDMVEGSISKWLKQEGDSVKAEEAIAEVETDKSTVEMPAPEDGVLLKIAVGEGDLVPVGAVVAYIGKAGEAVPSGGGTSASNGQAGSEAQRAEAPIDTAQAGPKNTTFPNVEVPKQDTSVPAATSASHTDADGDVKASPVAKRLAEQEGIDLHKVKGTGPGGRVTKEDVEQALVALMNAEPAPPDGVKASPMARRVAREKGYTISQIKGSGPDGRIVVQDVLDFTPAKAEPAVTESGTQKAETATATPANPTEASPVAGIGASEEVPLSRMRKRISQVLTASKAPVPHFYVTMDIDMEAASKLREQMNASLSAEGIKISFNDLVVKATALALRKFSNINASFAGDKIIKHGDVNVGIAVSTPNGLLTIATRQTDKVSLSELSSLTRARAGRAREGKVQPDDLGGTTFTVSNLGMYGVDSFVAIITPPEAGILAIGGIRQEPVVKDGQIVIGSRMKVTLSADHRVTDGAEGAEFVVEIKRLLENPMRLML
jgi:pyruvate dehydrogenase E2 component (dihydrolipoamide acetyltransferase)